MKRNNRLSSAAQSVWLPWLLAGMIALQYCAFSAYVARHAQQVEFRNKLTGHSLNLANVDFYVYYLAAFGFSHGYDVYNMKTGWAQLAREAHVTNFAPPYRYPPLTALLIWPLTLCLRPESAARVWLVVNALAFLSSAWLIGRSSDSKWGVALAFLILLTFVPALTTLYGGQVNGLVLLALSVALHGLLRVHTRWTGFGIGVGIMLKVTPVGHLAYLAWKRQRHAVLIAFTAIVILLIACLPLVGLEDLLSASRNFRNLSAVGVVHSRGDDQSLRGVIFRTLMPHAWAWWMTTWLWASGSTLLVLATTAFCRPGSANPRLLASEFSMVTIAVTLITPYTFYHQLALLFIPFYVTAENALSRASDRWMLIPLGIGYTLTDLHGLLWHRFEPYPLLESTPFLTAVMIWGLLAYIIEREKRHRINTIITQVS